MFSVHFRRVRRRRRVRRHDDFSLSRQNRLSYILYISGKEYIGMAKWTGWPFNDLDLMSRMWHRLAQNLLARWKKNHSSDHYKTRQLYRPSHVNDLIRLRRSFVGNCYFGKFSFKNSDVFFSRSNTLLAISQELLVRLMWNEKAVHQLDTGYNMWPWPLTSLMTLTLDASRSKFKIAIFQELLVWLMWNERETK